MSCWPDRIELIGLPVNACKMLKVELYGFRLRTMKMRRYVLVLVLCIR